ncbi:hypothetical protein Q2T42_27245 [Leptolyngbya boryana CZ1]|uniref:Uncharacterized protein n=1 Tax=Leptolyngbya boryana CZ1 TaxID=3060204 RepID=A0AA97AVM1_LEPBY|nr:hypothetical protein [Leptolyngbya boryana]WNZ45491.1 hypothetical protein Q2T42_27245 [Leptolyngbya boryana CZ1]
MDFPVGVGYRKYNLDGKARLEENLQREGYRDLRRWGQATV